MNPGASFRERPAVPVAVWGGGSSLGVSLEAMPGGALAGVLCRQHARITHLLARVLNPGGQPPALPSLVHYVALHEAAEQSFLHPAALGRAAAEGDPQAVQERLDEERGIGSCFDRLGLLRANSADFMIQLGLLEEEVLDHCRAEEQTELSLLSRAVNPEELDHIARRLNLVDEWFDDAEASSSATDERPPRYADLHRRALHAFSSVSRLFL